MASCIESKRNTKDIDEAVSVLNKVILQEFGFKGNTKNYSQINNSFIHKILEHKITNPIGLSILYLLIAAELTIPLVGINSPGHFILAAVSEKSKKEIGTTDRIIDFYIDPFHNGICIEPVVFNKWLQKHDTTLYGESLIATPVDIVKRVLNNVIVSLVNSGEEEKASQLLMLNESL